MSSSGKNSINKVLIITTHFAPDKHVGAKRPTKFTKYLPKFDWQPAILTMDNRCYYGIDNSLNEDFLDCVDIFRQKNWCLSRGEKTPNTGSELVDGDCTGNKRGRFIDRIFSRLLLFNFRWLLPACYNGTRIVNEQQIDVLFSTSPNSEAHIVGLWLKMRTGLPWVADFRDPWAALNIIYQPGRIKETVDQICERAVVSGADHITAISRTLARTLDNNRGHRKKNNTTVIYNGYDADDFCEVDKIEPTGQPFTIGYLGTWGGGRSPESFLRAVGRLLAARPELKGQIRVNFIGEIKLDPEMHSRIDRIIIEEKLNGTVNMIPFLPYRKGLKLIKHCDVSLLVVSSFHSQVGCLSSKLFEYLYTGNPILALAPKESEEARIIRSVKGGEIVAPDDISGIARIIGQMYSEYKEHDLKRKYNISGIEKFERIRQTAMLSDVFNDLVSFKKTNNIIFKHNFFRNNGE